MRWRIRCHRDYNPILISKTKSYTSINNIRNKRVLSLETVSNSGGDGGSSNEDGSGNFHLDHDEDLNVFD
jgi:hypothetical protein